MINKKIVFAVLIFAGVSFSAEAERPSQDRSFKAGLGIAIGNSLYKGDNERVFPVPMIYYNYGKFGVSGSMIGYEIFEADKFSASLIAKWRFDGYEEDDSDYLDGMDDREMTLDGGIQIAYSDGWGKTTASFLTDMLGYHDGQEVMLSYSKRFSKKAFSLTPSVGVIYGSSNLCDYYYGVRADEQMPGRPEYNVSEAWNPFVSLNIGYELNEKWSLITLLGYKWLDDEISNSPIVDSTYEAVLMTGLLYTF
ncbi:MAG: MipA/OmpV family protein [Sedimentisphaeraceae bacterium JB056]